MKRYFPDGADEQLYKQYAQRLHPDRNNGGSSEFIAMKAEYDSLIGADNNIDKECKKRIYAAFSILITHDMRVSELLHKMRGDLADLIHSCTVDIKRAKDAMYKLKDAIDAIEVESGGPNMFVDAIEDRIMSLERQIADDYREIAIHKECLRILSSYKMADVMRL